MRKRLTHLTLLVLTLGLIGTTKAAFDTVGVYDPDDEPYHNQVDQSGTYSSHTGDAGPENVIDLATFQALIGPAFKADAGGVVNIESTYGNLDGQDIIAKFGAGKTRSVKISNTSGLINTGSSVKEGRTPISGRNRLAKTDTPNFAFEIGAVTGGKPGEVVTYFGGSLLDRDGANLVPVVTATFSGGGTVTAVATMSGNPPSSDQDTFFGFVAPPGQSIVNVDFNPTGGPYTNMDDVAFITSAFVPVTREASSPNPQKGQVDVRCDTVLSWLPGAFARTHDVYFGSAFADVNTADRTSPNGVLVSRDQETATYAPSDPLAFGRTYYWRVDEVNAPPGSSIVKGKVWNFTVEPYAYPIRNVTATASSAQEGMGPEKTVDGSGLDAADRHSTESNQMWLSAGVQPNWIQFEFDKAYKLHELWVWNSNQGVEPIVGLGAKEVTVEYSVDGSTWTALAGVPVFARASGSPDYVHDTVVHFGVLARYVKLTVTSTWGGRTQSGLSEVRFLYVPDQAREPQPAVGATDQDRNVTLGWRPGREAASHRVYLSTDEQAVAEGAAPVRTVAGASCNPGSLLLDATYYWRVDEVNDAASPAVWAGEVWSFATQKYAVIDDFESYTNDSPHRVFQTWRDGTGFSADESFPIGYSGNGTGAAVGHDIWSGGYKTLMETANVHGGEQAMPLYYDNTAAPSYSEAVRTFDPPADWTTGGIKSLSLYFRGAAGNAGQLYLKVNGAKVPYSGNASDIARPAWLAWNIDLSAVGGGLNQVTTLTIGVEGAGAKGVVYIDDIRLYPRTPEYYTPADPGKANLLALYACEGNANDTSGHGLNGTVKQAVFVASGRPGGGSAVKLQKAGYLDLGNPASLDFGAGDWTVTAWFKTTMAGISDADKGTVVSKGGDGTGGKRYGLVLGETASGVVSLVTDDDVTKYMTDSKSRTNDDQWHFVAAQRAGTVLRIYIDGQPENSTAIPAAYDLAGTSQHNAYIGAMTNHADGSLYKLFDGLLDEVHMYNRALSQEEILWLAGYTPPVGKPF